MPKYSHYWYMFEGIFTGEATNGIQVPKDLGKFPGEFVVFFSDDEEPTVLFHSVIATEAHEFAERIFTEQKRRPLVVRVRDNKPDSVVQMLLARA